MALVRRPGDVDVRDDERSDVEYVDLGEVVYDEDLEAKYGVGQRH